MNAFLTYFKLHPWQRRVLTLSIAAIVGVVAAWTAWPEIRNAWIIDLLGSSGPAEQNRGLEWVAQLAPRSPRLIERLNEELPEADEVLFANIVEALSRLGRFDTPDRPVEQLDRYRAICLANAHGYEGAAEVRRLFLNDLVRSGRDNAHVRRALSLAAADGDVLIRADAGALAARLGDDAALEALLGDEDPFVRGVAAIDAGLAGRTALTATIARRLAESDDADEVPSCAFALARLDKARHAAAILDRFAATGADKPVLRERMLYVIAMLEGDRPRETVLGLLRDARKDEGVPPAMALVAAGKLSIADARPIVADVISQLIAKREKMTVAESVALTAAIGAARRLKMPAATFADCVRNLWNPRLEPAMILAAEGLGERARADDAEMIELLQRASNDSRLPVAAAAAASSLFRLTGPEATEALQTAGDTDTWLAGDYIAWHVARSGRDEAGLVAASFFGHHVYSKAVRSVGAVLLAMVLRGTDSAADAETIIRSRMDSPYGGENDPFVAGSYRCALLILGDAAQIAEADILAGSDTFPKRRALTALALAGAPAGFDRVFAAAEFDPGPVDEYLTGRLMARVYAELIGEMPEYHIDAPAEVRAWQCRLVREHYLIHRAAITGKMRP